MRTIETNVRILTDASTRLGFIAALNNDLTGCWSSSPVALRGVRNPGLEVHYFTYTGDERGHIELGLRAEDDGSLVACEVLARFGQEKGLTEDDRSHVRTDFCAQAKPIADALGIQVDVSRSPVDAEDILDPPEVTLLKNLKFFSDQGVDCLRSAEDWHMFVVETYRKESELTEDDLRDWLIGKGWNSESVDVLARDYNFGHALLKLYEEGRSRNFR